MHMIAISRIGKITRLAACAIVLIVQFSASPTKSAEPSTVIRSQPLDQGVPCPKCGLIHSPSQAAPRVAPGVPVQNSWKTVSSPSEPASQPRAQVASVAHQSVLRSATQNVLGMLNRQRSRQGLRSLRYDASLQSVAERRARQMASTGSKSHPPGSIAPGRYEGVGWSSSFSPSGVSACYTSDPNMTVAGAAMVTGRDGVYFAVVYR